MTTKEQDDRNYKRLLSDIERAKARLRGQAARENFGQDEVRKLKDKYSSYMCGNWCVCGRFIESVRNFDDWCGNYYGGF